MCSRNGPRPTRLTSENKQVARRDALLRSDLRPALGRQGRGRRRVSANAWRSAKSSATEPKAKRPQADLMLALARCGDHAEAAKIADAAGGDTAQG